MEDVEAPLLDIRWTVLNLAVNGMMSLYSRRCTEASGGGQRQVMTSKIVVDRCSAYAGRLPGQAKELVRWLTHF